ncbi:MAG: immunoglobulin-like domain-containing protein, partial [Candidatus Paceibacterota bacterium]
MNKLIQIISNKTLLAALAVAFVFFMTIGTGITHAQSSNSAPSLTGVGNTSISVCEDSFNAMAGVSATDPDGDSVQIDVSGDNTLNTALSNNNAGTYVLTYIADDGNGGFDIVDRTITVNDESCGSSNSAPSITGVNNTTLTICDDSFDPMSGVSATDPDGDSVQIDVSGDGVLADALSNNTPGTYTLTYTADDGNGGFDIVDRTITVNNDTCGTGGPSGGNSAPSLTGVGNTSISVCEDSFNAMAGVSATDPDGDSVQIDVSGDNTLNTALSNNNAGTYVLTYIADDGNGGFDIVDRTITVNNDTCGTGGPSGGNSAPTITGIGNQTLTSCPSTFDAMAGVSATDPDGDSVQIDVSGDGVLNTALSNSNNGTYTLTYTADDGNGGIDIADRTITVDCAPS